MTVNAGDCAPAGEAAAAPSRARTARPDLTSEAVVQSQCKSQGLAGGHCLGHIHAESTPIDPEAQIRQPAAERRQPVGGQPTRSPADQPGLPSVPQHHEIGPLQREQRLDRFVLGCRRAVRPVQREVTTVLGLRQDYPVARRHQGPGERGVDDVLVAGAVVEPVAGQRIRPAHRQSLLQRERVPPDPAAGEESEVDAPRRAHAHVAPEVEEQAAERVRAVGGDRAAHGGGDAGLRRHVLGVRVLEPGAQPPPGRWVGAVVAGIEAHIAAERGIVPVVDRRVGTPRLVVAEHGPRVARRDALLPVVSQLELELRHDWQQSVAARDPWTVFRNDQAWRPNPPIDDGHYTALSSNVSFDTRNDRADPTAGWWLRARLEHAHSQDVTPQAGVPAAVRRAIATDGSYAFSRLFLDFRRYMRVSPSGRVNLRLLAGGWVGGDPLPLQQRLSMGGPDPLAGYGFHHSACNQDIVDPAFAGTLVAACDRVILAQAEYRGHLSLHWSYGSSAPEDEAVKSLFTLQGPDLVVLGDAGQAWLVGGGPGRLPADRLPTLGSWLADLGLGVDWGGFGVYVAKAVTAGEPLRFTLRLDHRF